MLDSLLKTWNRLSNHLKIPIALVGTLLLGASALLYATTRPGTHSQNRSKPSIQKPTEHGRTVETLKRTDTKDHTQPISMNHKRNKFVYNKPGRLKRVKTPPEKKTNEKTPEYNDRGSIQTVRE